MEDDYKKLVDKSRYFLKDNIRKTINFAYTDQNRGVAPPPLEKPYSDDKPKIKLHQANWDRIFDIKLANAMGNRESRRRYKDEPLTLEELSFLLWATQGVRYISGPNAFRTVPSAGCRHALETYLAIFNVEDINPGIYRYLPLSHELLFEKEEDNISEKVARSTMGQIFAGNGAVTFIWSAIPYRMEWRYGLASYKEIALDAGHVCQNLYLACEAIGAGTCAIAAYDQEYMDKLLELDGEDEFAIYIAPVGKI
ncbi:SagB/ThcOx family dehydrogenase [Methanobacterium sp. ACI-7]|uniref:SagB/ThcOx family dehydrogenase n=1 Tax=unclassified Methanobacterium TaxID=2627676 RepID=UPI0039C00477